MRPTKLLKLLIPNDNQNIKNNLNLFNSLNSISSLKSSFYLLRNYIAFFTIVFVLSWRYSIGGKQLPLLCNLFSLQCPIWPISGNVENGYENVIEAFKLNFAEGLEIGASFTAYVNNNPVVDLSAGYHDRFFRRPYNNQSLQLVFSSSKFVEGVVMAYLVDKKLISYNQTIASLWPEFAQGNKEHVLISCLLGHRAGVTFLDQQPSLLQIGNLDEMAKLLASQPHNFNGSSVQGYHAVTRGWYLNEIVRRVDPKKRSMGQLIREEIMPLTKTEYYLNIPTHYESRISPLMGTPALRTIAKFIIPERFQSEPLPKGLKALMDRNSIGFKALAGSAPKQIIPFPHSHNRKEIWRSEGPSYSGITNSASLARLAAYMANEGTLDGHEFITPATINEALVPLKWMPDTVVTRNVTFTTGGWGLNITFPGSETYRWIGWGGIGGSMVWWNPDKKLAFSYVMNACSYSGIGDIRSWRLVEAFTKAYEASLVQ
ncbi:hypothetical protein HDV02_002076 [Globomyces sp. JEL0801]|nr:hypothetical protein HDV02_002076 [Globomyces sp. JEL0801]